MTERACRYCGGLARRGHTTCDALGCVETARMRAELLDQVHELWAEHGPDFDVRDHAVTKLLALIERRGVEVIASPFLCDVTLARLQPAR